MRCRLCGSKGNAQVACESGHFVCDACHRAPAIDIIEKQCLGSDSRDPMALALDILRSPAVNMHGPEHHFLVPAVLITAYSNLAGGGTKAARLVEARKRAAQVRGGFCGFQGSCGAAVGAGIFVSVVTGATPLSKEEWRLSNLVTAQCLRAIALSGGPRCCKRNTYLAVQGAARFARRYLEAPLRIARKTVCRFHKLNKECLGESCGFFPAKASGG